MYSNFSQTKIPLDDDGRRNGFFLDLSEALKAAIIDARIITPFIWERSVPDESKYTDGRFFREEFYDTYMPLRLTNGGITQQVCVQYHIPGHKHDNDVMSPPHLHVRPVVNGQLDQNEKFVSENSYKKNEIIDDVQRALINEPTRIIKDVYYISIQLRKVPLNAVIEKGWRILEYEEAREFKELINPLLTDWSIVAFKTGKLDGNGYGNKFSPSYGPECGEKIIIKIEN